MYTLYMIQCSDGSLYTGIARDLEKRLKAHRTGIGSKYVRAHLPFELVYTEECKDRSKATKREYEIKQLSKKEKQTLLS